MKATKFLVSAVASASLIGAIGFAYAQSDSGSPTMSALPSDQAAGSSAPTAQSNSPSSTGSVTSTDSSTPAAMPSDDTERAPRADRG